MSCDKEVLLARVRAALPAGPRPDTAIPRDYRREEARAGEPAVLDLFAERLDHLGARSRRCTAAEVPGAVAELVRDAGVSTLITPPGLPAEWLPDTGFRLLSDEPQLPTDQVDRADGVITAVAVVAADTGTILLDGGAGQGRRMLTLLPDYQLCVVRAEQVVSGLPAALAAVDPRRPITFVTGPSATVDIELVRVSGVHGPRRLDVVVVTR